MDLERILEDLENMILDAPRVPLTNKSIIDTEQLGQVLDAVRTTMPLEIKQARQLLNDRDRRISEAMEEKQKIIDQAQVMAEKLISEQEVYRQAKESAQQMIQKANEESTEIRYDAQEYSQKLRAEAVDFANKIHEETMDYVKEIFDYLEITLGKTTDALRHSRETIAKRTQGE